MENMKNDFAFDKWSQETDIHEVCKHLLDNADLAINLESNPFSLQLTFYVVGTILKVIFYCGGIELFRLKKDWDDCPLFLVLDTTVTEPQKQLELNISSSSSFDTKEYLWKIFIHPRPLIQIECLQFKWRVEQMSEEEIKWLNSP
jgi:hypothetical protein